MRGGATQIGTESMRERQLRREQANDTPGLGGMGETSFVAMRRKVDTPREALVPEWAKNRAEDGEPEEARAARAAFLDTLKEGDVVVHSGRSLPCPWRVYACQKLRMHDL